MFGKRHKRGHALKSFGLEIDRREFRFASLRADRRTPTVEHIGEGSVPSSAWENDIIAKPKELASVILQTAKEERLHLPKYVVASVPDDACYIFTIALQTEGTGDLDESIRWEASQHLPLPLDNVYLDWQALGDRSGVQRYQIAAAPKKLVDSYMEVFEHCSFTPIAVEASSLAALRIFDPTKIGEKATLLLLVGLTSTLLACVTDQGIPLTMTTANFSGERLIEILTERLKLKAGEAKKALRICGLDPACSRGVVRHALGQEMRALLEHVSRLRDYCQQFAERPCDQLILSGSHSTVRSLADELQGKTGMSVYTTPLRSDVTFASQSDAPLLHPNTLPAFTTVLGLALTHQ